MSNEEARTEAKRLAEEHGLHQAYALVKNRIVREENNWHWKIDREKIAADQLILDALAHLLAAEAMERQGWQFTKPSEGEPAEWSFGPFEWEIDQRGFTYCPLCHERVAEDEYTGKPITSEFCPKCGYRLTTTMFENALEAAYESPKEK